MPVYEPSHIEHTISSGYSQVVSEDGKGFPAYTAYPRMAGRFPGIVLIHDWWGLTPPLRRLANLFAQVGYHVVVPDLFDGQTARDAKSALKLLRTLGAQCAQRVSIALDVVERHHQSNSQVAAVGLGMGGGLAFEAAVSREDLEAAVAFNAMPQAYFGRFQAARTPIMAVYGSANALIPAAVIDTLRRELAAATLAEQHRLIVAEGIGHDFFVENGELPQQQVEQVRWVISQTLGFLDLHLRHDQRRASRK